MKKVKFILEVDEQYIEDRIDVQKSTENIKDNSDKLLVALLDAMAFSSLKKALDEGKDEFIINQSCLENDKESHLFNSSVRYCASLAMTKREEENKSVS